MLTYLASPYTCPDPAVRQQRYEETCRATADLLRSGKTIYSPIVFGHALCAFDLPGDWQFWQKHDRRFLEVCDEVIVLQLDGWEKSVGVQAEVAIARRLGKPVTFIRVGTTNEDNPELARG
jgi:hypothetical protein